MSSEYYDRDQELDVEVNYKLEIDGGTTESAEAEETDEADETETTKTSFRRPSQLRELDIELDESSNLVMESIEKQSPIIERELLTTEQQLENLRSRLAMSESVSAVTRSVLESIRREYNLPEQTGEKKEEITHGVEENELGNEENDKIKEEKKDDEVLNSSSNDEAVDYLREKEAEILAGDESLLTSSSGNEAEPDAERALTDDDAAIFLSTVNEEMRERLEKLEIHLREKQVHDVIEQFARESQTQIEKIMMIQNLEEPDEVEEEPVAAAVQVQSSDDSSSKAQDESVGRKLSLSQTHLIEEDVSAESGEDIRPLAPTESLGHSVRKLSISQTRLIEDASESDSANERIERKEPIVASTNIDELCEKPYDQFGALSKSRQYQTFESSSSTNSDLNKQEEFRRKPGRDDKHDNDEDDDEMGGDGSGMKATADDTGVAVVVEPAVPSISYSSGEVSSESIAEAASVSGKHVEPKSFLTISPGIKESESRELLLEQDEGKVDEEEELEASASLESFACQRQLLEPSGHTMDGSNEDVSVTTVIEQSRPNDEHRDEIAMQKQALQEKQSSTEISSEAYETDEENRPLEPTTIEAVTLLSSSEDQEDDKNGKDEAGMRSRSGGSSENLDVSVDLITEETVVERVIAQPQLSSSQAQTVKSLLYLDLEPVVNKSESREPLIPEPPVIEELTLEEVIEYPNDSPPLMYENSSCGASMTSCSTMSDENLVRPTVESSDGDAASIDHQLSKSLTYLESLVVPSCAENSSLSELFYKLDDTKKEEDKPTEGIEGDPSGLRRGSQSLNFNKSAAVRPASFTVKPTGAEFDEDLGLQQQQLEQEQQTPTPVENVTSDFFDKRITSSNEPSIDRFTSSDQLKTQESVREISNESLASYEGVKSETEETEEAKAAIATALLFSSTIKSQSSDEVKSIASVQQTKQTDDEEHDLSVEDLQA